MGTSSLLQSKRGGLAIPLVLLAVIILLATGTGLLSIGLQGRLMSIRTSQEIAARCAADAGLIKALFEMNQKLMVSPWSDSVLPTAADQDLEGCGAVFSYTVATQPGGGYSIESVGNFSIAQRTVSSSLRLQGPFEAAIFVESDLTLKADTIVDWYNNDADDKSLKIGTNSTASGTVQLKSGSTINGDVKVGCEGDPDVVINNTGATITGETGALTERYEFTPVTVPEWLASLPSEGSIDDDMDGMTITTSGKYDEIDLGNSKIVTVANAVTLYITGDVELDNSAQLVISDTNPDASLTLYLGGNVEVKNGGAINNLTGNAKKLKIYGLAGCTDMDFKNGTNFYGAIYAPNADVTFFNSGDAYGAVVAQSFEQKNSAGFHYDASLRDVSVNDEAVRFVVGRWGE